MIQGEKLDEIFSLNDGRIIVSADKNLGCTIMEIEHYRKQYDLINSQQHFGKVDLDEDIYITQILDYLKYMLKNIPRQLNKIVNRQTLSMKIKRQISGFYTFYQKY